MFFYSLSGGIFSLLVMFIFKNRYFSVVGVSILGGISHNIGQLLVAAIVLGKNALYYYPVLLISGAIMGFITGIVCSEILKFTKK